MRAYSRVHRLEVWPSAAKLRDIRAAASQSNRRSPFYSLTRNGWQRGRPLRLFVPGTRCSESGAHRIDSGFIAIAGTPSFCYIPERSLIAYLAICSRRYVKFRQCFSMVSLRLLGSPTFCFDPLTSVARRAGIFVKLNLIQEKEMDLVDIMVVIAGITMRLVLGN